MRLAIFRATIFRATLLRTTWCVFLFVASALGTDRLDAAITYLDGVGAPTLYNSIVIGDFNDRSSQGWTASENFSGGDDDDFFFFLESDFGDPDDNYSLANDFPTALNEAEARSDPYIQLKLSDSPLAGVPDNFTVGTLPGQFNIISFDLRFDSLPPALTSGDAGSELVRGDQSFLNGANRPDRAIFFDNDGGVTAASQGDTALAFRSGPGTLGDSQFEFSNIIIRRFPSDEGFGDVFDSVRIDPIGDDPTSVGTLLSIDNVILSRSNGIQPFPEQVGEGIDFGDVNKDSSIDATDTELMNSLLDHPIGAVFRQNELIAEGYGSDEVLESLNLTDFDLNSDDFFDSRDVGVLDSLINGAPNGDWDNNGNLDGTDFLLWQRLDGIPATLAAWQANFGEAPLGAASAVPEPGSIVLFGLAVALVATRRCRILCLFQKR